jgi:hypothetical protein
MKSNITVFIEKIMTKIGGKMVEVVQKIFSRTAG